MGQRRKSGEYITSSAAIRSARFARFGIRMKRIGNFFVGADGIMMTNTSQMEIFFSARRILRKRERETQDEQQYDDDDDDDISSTTAATTTTTATTIYIANNSSNNDDDDDENAVMGRINTQFPFPRQRRSRKREGMM